MPSFCLGDLLSATALEDLDMVFVNGENVLRRSFEEAVKFSTVTFCSSYNAAPSNTRSGMSWNRSCR